MSGNVFTAEVNRGSPLDLYGRVTSPVGTGAVSPISDEWYLLKQENVSSISVKSYVNGTLFVTASAPSVAGVIVDALQTELGWPAEGGNASYSAPAALFDTAAELVRLVIEFTLTNTTKAYWLVNVTVRQIVQ